jgi:hypothetical protein
VRGSIGQVESIPNMWEVLRWFGVFVIAVLLIVFGLFTLMGRPLPIPNLF